MLDHSHSHNHASHRTERSTRRVKLALILTCIYMIAEAVGGYLTNSLALLADAGHMLTDVAALTLTLTAFWFAARPANPRKTYGYYRLEILAAFVNGVALVLISLWIFYEAYERFFAPAEIKSAQMIAVAVGGLATNLLCAYLLHGSHEHNLNLRGAWLHVVSDALGSVAAISAGLMILFFGWTAADSLSSALIALIIIFGSWRLIRESVNVLLEGTPSHINIAALEDTMLKTEGVQAVHDLHVWTITSGRDALSAHVVHRETASANTVLRRLQREITEHFGISHLTIQMEMPETDQNPCPEDTDCFQSEVSQTMKAKIGL
ncbi:MAG: cation diffusion facilitator family transporter [Acidobacteriota bacterium]|nr:cation diffusion facilitator family transporter [Acidobacteriota bacterium]